MINNTEFIYEHLIRFYNTLKPQYKFDLTKQLMSNLQTETLIELAKRQTKNPKGKIITTMAHTMLDERLKEMGVYTNEQPT